MVIEYNAHVGIGAYLSSASERKISADAASQHASRAEWQYTGNASPLYDVRAARGEVAQARRTPSYGPQAPTSRLDRDRLRIDRDVMEHVRHFPQRPAPMTGRHMIAEEHLRRVA